MLFKDIAIIDENLTVKENMFVGIKGETIDYIGNTCPSEEYGEVYSGKDKLLLSGFVNSHAHTPMTLLRGYGENMVLSDWLNNRIFPFEDKLNGQDVYYSTLLGIAEMLRFGSISATDMYFFTDDMSRAILDSGFKCNLSRAILSFTDQPLNELENFHQAKELYKNYNNAGDGRLKVDMSIHAEYTSTPKVVQELSEYCKEIGANMHIHLSETKEEHEACKKRHNSMTPTEYFNSLGLFDNRTTAAHCVWLEGDDFDILKEKGVIVATCPVSNLKLASGFCNVLKLLEKEIPLAIGTDSVASNNNLDMIEEMKFFAVIHKGVNYDPTLITPEQAINSASYIGMMAQGRSNCGKLKEGFKADLTVLDLSSPHLHPVHNHLNNLVFSSHGNDVALTMVDGKVLYNNGVFPTIDMEKVVYEVNRSKERILNELER